MRHLLSVTALLVTLLGGPTFAQDQGIQVGTPIADAIASLTTAVNETIGLRDERIADQEFGTIGAEIPLYLIMMEDPSISEAFDAICPTGCRFTFSIENGHLVLVQIEHAGATTHTYKIEHSQLGHDGYVLVIENTATNFFAGLREDLERNMDLLKIRRPAS